MDFSTRQLSNGKWGIYSGNQLLTTVGCKLTCDTIMDNLMSGRRDAPLRDIDALYQAPKLRREREAEQKAALAAEQNSVSTADNESVTDESESLKNNVAVTMQQEPAIV